jgi:hypothetical protein
MSIPGRYFSERDIRFFNSINNELLRNVIQIRVRFFKANADNTKTNIYGESDPKVGKTYYPGIDIFCLVDRADIDVEIDDFGPTRSQNAIFKFMEKDLQEINFFPQTGDIIQFNDRYYECDNIVQEQFIGGQPEKSFSIIVHTFYTRLSHIDIVSRT